MWNNAQKAPLSNKLVQVTFYIFNFIKKFLPTSRLEIKITIYYLNMIWTSDLLFVYRFFGGIVTNRCHIFLIILRLVPSEPTSADKFREVLNTLTIAIYDLTVDNKDDALLGTVSGLANYEPPIDPVTLLPDFSKNLVNINGPTPPPRESIIQHYFHIYSPIPPYDIISRNLLSAATAVMVVNVPAAHHEYPTPTSFDIRLEIKRGTIDIIDHTLQYNVTVTTVADPLPNDQRDYFDFGPETPNPFPTSAYVTLPPSTVGLDPKLANIDLPSNGQPPNFEKLRDAIP